MPCGHSMGSVDLRAVTVDKNTALSMTASILSRYSTARTMNIKVRAAFVVKGRQDGMREIASRQSEAALVKLSVPNRSPVLAGASQVVIS